MFVSLKNDSTCAVGPLISLFMVLAELAAQTTAEELLCQWMHRRELSHRKNLGKRSGEAGDIRLRGITDMRHEGRSGLRWPLISGKLVIAVLSLIGVNASDNGRVNSSNNALDWIHCSCSRPLAVQLRAVLG